MHIGVVILHSHTFIICTLTTVQPAELCKYTGPTLVLPAQLHQIEPAPQKQLTKRYLNAFSIRASVSNRLHLPAYTINRVTTSTSYRTRGFLILENTSASSGSLPLPSGKRTGETRESESSTTVARGRGLPDPIIFSYALSLDCARATTAGRPSEGRESCLLAPSAAGDARLLSERLSRRRFCRYASVS